MNIGQCAVCGGALTAAHICNSPYAWKTYPAIPEPPITLRDWFAGQALAGILTSKIGADLREGVVAECAYSYADAMLAQREKKL